jgi:hypothetical protein
MVEVGRLRDVRAVRWSAHPDGAAIISDNFSFATSPAAATASAVIVVVLLVLCLSRTSSSAPPHGWSSIHATLYIFHTKITSEGWCGDHF